MEAVKNLFRKINRNKTSNEIKGFAHYRELLINLATGKDEIDPATAAEILEHAGKTETDLESDVQTMTKRIDWRTQFERGQAAAKELPAAEQKLAQCVQDFHEAQQRLQPLINAAYQEKQQIEQAWLTTSSAKKYLAGSCLDPDILDRDEVLKERKMELHRERTAIEEKVSGSIRTVIEIEREIEKYAGDENKLEALQQHLTDTKAKRTELQKQLEQLDKQRAASDREQAVLHLKKLEI